MTNMTYKKSGFTLIEMIVYVAIVAIIVTAIAVFATWLIQVGTKIKISQALLDNGRQAMDTIIYEVKKSQSVYTPTSVFGASPGQLSLAQSTTVLSDEDQIFVDVFQCGQAVCLKREGSNPINLTNEQVRVTNLTFNQMLNSASIPSVQIHLRLQSSSSSSRPEYQDFIDLTSTANLRSY